MLKLLMEEFWAFVKSVKLILAKFEEIWNIFFFQSNEGCWRMSRKCSYYYWLLKLAHRLPLEALRRHVNVEILLQGIGAV